MSSNKIKIAVSSCLLGEAVRYDGSDKNIPFISERLSNEYNLISLCPEMAVGMGVPRDPIHLLDDGKSIQAVDVNNIDKNMTAALRNYGQSVFKTHSDICGYIFKKNSPSCGTKNVKVLNINAEYERRGQGIYAAELIRLSPLLPVIDEEESLDSEKFSQFLSAVIEYAEYKR